MAEKKTANLNGGLSRPLVTSWCMRIERSKADPWLKACCRVSFAILRAIRGKYASRG